MEDKHKPDKEMLDNLEKATSLSVLQNKGLSRSYSKHSNRRSQREVR